MRFKDFITEKRRNPEVNKKVSSVDILKQYKGRENVFVSFTDLNKLGINPKSSFDTPLGIYAYPIDKAIEYNKDNYMFATNKPIIHIFEVPTSQITRISKYTENDYKRDLEKLRKSYFAALDDKAFEDTLGLFLNRIKNKEPFTKLWFLTKRLADTGMVHIVNNTRVVSEPKRLTAKTEIIQWNKVLRELGYYCINDDMGSGTIHPNEPFQSVCLSTKYIKILQTIDNKKIGKEITIITKWSDPKLDLIFQDNDADGGGFYELFAELLNNYPTSKSLMVTGKYGHNQFKLSFGNKKLQWKDVEPLWDKWAYFFHYSATGLFQILDNPQIVKYNAVFIISMFEYIIKKKLTDYIEFFKLRIIRDYTLSEIPEYRKWYLDFLLKTFKITNLNYLFAFDGKKYHLKPEDTMKLIKYLVFPGVYYDNNTITLDGKTFVLKNSNGRMFKSTRLPILDAFVNKKSFGGEVVWITDMKTPREEEFESETETFY